MARVVLKEPGTISIPRDVKPTSATVTITRDRDSSAVVTAQACTVEAERVFYVLAAQTSIANLTAVFTIVDARGTSTLSIPVEVVSGRVCSIADCRRLAPLDDANRYPDELILGAITGVEVALEDACGVSFVGREVTGLHDGNGTFELFLRASRPQSITSVTVAGVALATDEFNALVVDVEGGVLIKTGHWQIGRRNVMVTGVFGLSTVPGMVANAAALAVRQALVSSRVDPRAVSVTNEDGTTAVLVTASVRGAIFSLPEMNQVVAQYRTTFGVA